MYTPSQANPIIVKGRLPENLESSKGRGRRNPENHIINAKLFEISARTSTIQYFL